MTVTTGGRGDRSAGSSSNTRFGLGPTAVTSWTTASSTSIRYPNCSPKSTRASSETGALAAPISPISRSVLTTSPTDRPIFSANVADVAPDSMVNAIIGGSSTNPLGSSVTTSSGPSASTAPRIASTGAVGVGWEDSWNESTRSATSSSPRLDDAVLTSNPSSSARSRTSRDSRSSSLATSYKRLFATLPPFYAFSGSSSDPGSDSARAPAWPGSSASAGTSSGTSMSGVPSPAPGAKSPTSIPSASAPAPPAMSPAVSAASSVATVLDGWSPP